MLLERLVVGSCVNSALFSFLTDSYYLPTLKFGPLFYKSVPIKIFSTAREDYTWSRLLLLLSLSGRLLSYEEIQNIRLAERIVKISTRDGFFKYGFGKCAVFDPTSLDIENLPITASPEMYLVYDDFELSNLGGKHTFLDSKNSKGPLAKNIHYYTSDRVDGANYVTDCVVESQLTKQQIHSFDYSDTMARFAVERHLQEIGIKGSFMNFYKNGAPKYRKPKVFHKKRIVIEKDTNSYQNSQSIKFLNMSWKEILDGASTAWA